MTALPLVRPRTYVDSDPIIPGDLVEIFDSIIGYKHGSLVVPIAAQDWRAEDGQVTYTNASGKWTWAGFDFIVVGLRIPVGTRVTSSKFNFNRTGGTLNFKFQKRAANAGAWTDIVTGQDLATAGVGTKILASAEVIAADTQYRYYIDSSGVATADIASYTIDRL